MESNIMELELRDIAQKKLHDIAQKMLDKLHEKIPSEIIENLKEKLKKDPVGTFQEIVTLYTLGTKNLDTGMPLRYTVATEAELAKQKERLQKACMELEAECAEKDRQIEILLAKLKAAKEEYRELTDDLVQQRLKEFKESTQDQSILELIQVENGATAELESLYRARIEEKYREIVRLSQEIQKIRKERNELEERIHDLHRRIKLYDECSRKYEDNAQFLTLPPGRSFSLPQFIKSLQRVNSEVRKINEEILSLTGSVSSIPPGLRSQVIQQQESLLQEVAGIGEALDTVKASLLKLEEAIRILPDN